MVVVCGWGLVVVVVCGWGLAVVVVCGWGLAAVVVCGWALAVVVVCGWAPAGVVATAHVHASQTPSCITSRPGSSFASRHERMRTGDTTIHTLPGSSRGSHPVWAA